MVKSRSVVEIDGKNVLGGIGIILGEEHCVVEVRVAGRVERERSLIHESLCGVGGKLEVVLVGVGAFDLDSMVLSVGPFIEAETGLEGERSPLCHAVVTAAVALRKPGYSLVDIFYHMSHDDLAGISCLVEDRVVGTEFMVNPWNIAETLYLVKVEVCPEEFAESRVLYCRRRILALLRNIVQAGVDSAEVGPGPAAA